MIRKANLSETQEIIAITRACGAKMASEGIFQWNEHYPSQEAFKKDIERDELYVILSEASVIGCVVISSEKDSEYNDIEWLTEDKNQYYIHRLAVHPNFQNKGYAKKLMDFSEARAIKNKITSIRLDTFSKNTRNQKFYETRAYQRLGNIYFPKQSEHPFYCYEKIL
jgi:ribosomal protein S18 acetylase RimI-like enzyme